MSFINSFIIKNKLNIFTLAPVKTNFPETNINKTILGSVIL